MTGIRLRLLPPFMLASTALSALATPTCAQAQNADAGAGEGLEDIIVTARRRAENLQDTPVSVTALTATALTDRSVASVADLDGFVPNAEITTGAGNSGSPGFSSFFVRGIGQTDSIITSDPGVGLYVDGVYLARSPGSVLDLMDVERIEVLRGPQGTLFGKNTIGGAINVVTSPPSFTPEGRVEFTGGRFGRADARAYLSGPLGGTVAAKLAISYRHLDGYGRRLDPATDRKRADTGRLNDFVVRAGLLWKAGDRFSADFGFDYTRNRDSSVPQTVLIPNPSATLLGIYNGLVGAPTGTVITPSLAAPGRYDSYATGGNTSRQDIYGYRLTLNYDLSDTTSLKSISAYRKLDSFATNDGDGTAATYLSSLYDLRQKQFSQEMQLAGKAFDGRLNWLMGAYYLRETASELFDGRVASGLYSTLESLPAAIIPIAAGVSCPAPFPAPCIGGSGNPYNSQFEVDYEALARIKTQSYAVFAQGSYQLLDRLSVTVGLRQTWEDKSLLNVYRRKRLSGVVVIPANTRFDESYTAFSPKLGLEYKLNEDVLVYASVAQGFKSGGFNGRALTTGAFGSFDPEKVWSYETGLKSEFFDRRVRLNLAGFYNDYSDIQLTQEQSLPDGTVDIRVINAGTVEMWGFEAELQARPFDGLDLNAGVGYIDASYKRIAAGVPIGIDNRLPFVSDWTFNAGAQYRLALGGAQSLTVRADYAYRSSFFVDAGNSPFLHQPGYGLLSARLTYGILDDRIALSVFGTNLTDEDYLTGGLDASASLGVVQLQKGGRPREWGASVRFSF